MEELLNMEIYIVLAFLSKNGVVLYENIYSIEEIYAVLAFLSKNGIVLYENIYSMEEIEDMYFSKEWYLK